VDSAKVGVFKERDKVSLNGLLESTDRRRLEAEIRLEVLGDFTNQSLERKLANQELGRLLVTTDLTESDGTRLISVRLLDTTGRWCRFAGSLVGELLTRSLSSRRLTGGLLGTSHSEEVVVVVVKGCGCGGGVLERRRLLRGWRKKGG
jgi:CRISPR/Cas system-associated protein Csm6